MGKQAISYRIVFYMISKFNVSRFHDTYELCHYVDYILLEIFNMLTTPSVLWTTHFSSVLPLLFEVVTHIVHYVYPIVLVIGLLCNIIALLFSVSVFRLSNLSIFLIILAVFDSLALICNLLPTLYKFYYHYIMTQNGKKVLFSSLADFQQISTLSCKLSHYITGFFRALSGWTMVSSAVVRMLAVARPLKWRHRNIRFNIKVICGTILTTAVVTSSPLFTRYLSVYNLHGFQIRFCHRLDYVFFTYTVELYLNALMFPILPVVFIIFVNSLTLCILRYSSKSFISNKTQNVPNCGKRKDLRATLTLIIVSFTFSVLSLPYFANTLSQLYSIYDFQVAYSGITRGTGPLFNYEHYIFTLILTLSNAINLFLYLLSGKTWRKKFWKDVKKDFS